MMKGSPELRKCQLDIHTTFEQYITDPLSRCTPHHMTLYMIT